MSNKKTALLTGALVVASIFAIHMHRAQAKTISNSGFNVACVKNQYLLGGVEQELLADDAYDIKAMTGDGYMCFFKFKSAQPMCGNFMMLLDQPCMAGDTCQINNPVYAAALPNMNKVYGTNIKAGKDYIFYPGRGGACLFDGNDHKSLIEALKTTRTTESLGGTKIEPARSGANIDTNKVKAALQ
jgi:hypothetical protein